VPAEVELGSHPWFSRIPFEVVLVNSTAESVSVATVSPSCGCTVMDAASYENAAIEPGGVLELDGTLFTAAEIGSHTKKIDVLLDSGSLRTAYLTYSTYETYSFAPSQLDFGKVRLDDPALHPTTSIAFSSQTVSIREPRVDSPWLRAAVVPAQGGATIAVGVDQRYLPYGPIHGRVTVVTDDLNRPEFSVDVRAEGTALVHAVPGHLFLRAGESRDVRLVRDDGEFVRCKAIACDRDNLSVSADGQAVSVAAPQRVETGVLGIVDVVSEDGAQCRFFVSIVE
jgi:hypothetical protein